MALTSLTFPSILVSEIRPFTSLHPHARAYAQPNRYLGSANVPDKPKFIRCIEGSNGFKKDEEDMVPSTSSSGAHGESNVSLPQSGSGELYSTIPSHYNGYLQVSDLHTIYYEIFGNPEGKPVVFLHGGPGAGCTERHARFFDPKHYRIILFDQRACGKSTPRGCLEENTTWHLVQDIEKLRKHLGVQRWIILGGSWGVALALAYAEAHPDAVSGLILRGVCLMRQKEIDWFYKQGANFLFPFGWEQLLSVLAPFEHQNVLFAFYKRLTSDDASTQLLAAQAWLKWEMGLSFFRTNDLVFTWDGLQYRTLPPLQAYQSSTTSGEHKAPISAPTKGLETPKGAYMNNKMPAQVVQARLECHYFINCGFFDKNQLLADISKIRHIPSIIIHGRYDFVCPLTNAFELHRLWPEAELRVVSNAGHSMYEKGISQEIIHASNQFRTLVY
ncbi:hypothetical protein O6H91_11G088600 [Diphasiastrum complanatum]|uniref:Uncharacterized protein n=1 Tax=Diphasiastrum complanatum TaxID=34168 RepID=A0ACC2CBD8_DIPCM|nr:hypothetical protein O6H91_Y381500 [Diphasiastrum complanatum]KAJ7298867.1 hypothetical protein O6H91_Y381500 [Diphasiastrum complanatum]KAJ7298868.1 hypothetical protein O6H91_Y381500 [Diphasiastrum complanatum]KAJ7298869.1 hypothetical protein O6H91_Y381500 [Diphasiastrum complanatum]KAJ7539353.1 hypothetical protein O6H91_11G088600 [Diphasiastrum complanatum]